jgi:hypothetical protein
VTTRLFSLFYETALRDGAQPVILIFPTRKEVAGWRSDQLAGKEHEIFLEPAVLAELADWVEGASARGQTPAHPGKTHPVPPG